MSEGSNALVATPSTTIRKGTIMAALRGTVTGNRGEASRLGSARSGLTTTAATWNGRVTVHLEADGSCRVVVDNPRRGGNRTVVWEGNVDEEAAR